MTRVNQVVVYRKCRLLDGVLWEGPVNDGFSLMKLNFCFTEPSVHVLRVLGGQNHVFSSRDQ
jgi:hypothetical protein